MQATFVSNKPHGGVLKDLIKRDSEKLKALIEDAKNLLSLVLTERHLCDLELILNGGFSPIDGFMTEEEHQSVVENMRLPNGLLWSMPITLDVSSKEIDTLKIQQNSRIALRDPRDDALLAILTVSDIYKPNKNNEALKVFGSSDDETHPAIHYLFNTTKEFYIGGKVDAVALPLYYDFVELRNTPTELRTLFQKLSWTRIVAFQTRNPMHRAHRELTVRAARSQKCNILVHPVVGLTKPGDIDHYTRVRVYKAILAKYPQGMATLSLLPLAMRMGGPREAIWHAIIRKNFGVSHFIVGRDHAGPGKNRDGKDFYGPFDAQSLIVQYKDELGVQVVPFKMVSYLPDTDEYVPSDEIPEGTKTLNISGTELRRRLRTGLEIPSWFTYQDVRKILRQQNPPRSQQGIAIFLIGHFNSGARKIAKALQCAFDQSGARKSSLFLGDTIEESVNLQLGQSDLEARSSNTTTSKSSIEVLAHVAAQLVKSGGVVISTPAFQSSADYAKLEKIVLEESGGSGGVYVIHVNTLLQSCIDSDRSGVYETGGAGQSSASAVIVDGGFGESLGEVARLTVDVGRQYVSQIVHEIVLLMEADGYLENSAGN